MPFDSETYLKPVTVTETPERQRMRQLRDFLAELPDERFDMSRIGVVNHEHRTCETPACIAGWANALFGSKYDTSGQMGPMLGLTPEQAGDLFRLRSTGASRQYDRDMWAIHATRAQALRCIDHYLATGQIDWSVAK